MTARVTPEIAANEGNGNDETTEEEDHGIVMPFPYEGRPVGVLWDLFRYHLRCPKCECTGKFEKYGPTGVFRLRCLACPRGPRGTRQTFTKSSFIVSTLVLVSMILAL